ncbi:MAG: ABC transporter ATP-binding protein [Rhodospirillales bacterium]
MANVSLRSVVKRYGKQAVVHGIDLEIADGEFLVMVGPSGCGKSTTLRMIAGLEDVSGGEIRIADRVVNDLEPKDRNIAMVFQNYALYPHMTVFDNIGFGLHAARLPKAEVAARVTKAAGMLGLADYLQRRPAQLSGGQRQRVAMGRAIVRDPAVVLFDEPLSHLDAQLRNQMRTEIKRLHQSIGTTIVYVTHDQVEAMTLADRIVIMRDGRVEQVGAPLDIFHRPANTFVAGFIGSPQMNMIEVPVRAGALDLGEGVSIPVPPRGGAGLSEGSRVILGIRPDDLVAADGARAAGVPLEGRVAVVEPLGTETQIFVRVGSHELIGKADGHHVPRPGEPIRLVCNVDRLHLFDAERKHALA